MCNVCSDENCSGKVVLAVNVPDKKTSYWPQKDGQKVRSYRCNFPH